MSQHYLGISTMVCDEREAVLRELIAFHEVVGVGHFTFYDNGSAIPVRDVLADLGNVEVVDWPGDCQQTQAMADSLERHRGRCRWLAYTDTDEFMFSPTYLPLPTILAYFEQFDAVGACWKMFGTGHRVSPAPSTLRAYTLRTRLDEPVNSHVKSIVQVDRVRPQVPPCPHNFDCETVDEYRRPFEGPFAPRPSWDRLVIHHYWSRSIEEARVKWATPRVDTNTLRDPDVNPNSKTFNAERDESILPLAPLTEARLRARRALS